MYTAQNLGLLIQSIRYEERLKPAFHKLISVVMRILETTD